MGGQAKDGPWGYNMKYENIYSGVIVCIYHLIKYLLVNVNAFLCGYTYIM